MESKSYFHDIVRAMSGVYFTSIYVDVNDDTYETIQNISWLHDDLPDHGSYTDMIENVIGRVIQKKYHAIVRQHFSLKNIRDKLNNQVLSAIHRSFSMDYQAFLGGEQRWIRSTIALADSAKDGSPNHVVCMLQDITEDKKQSTIDTLTGIYNRTYAIQVIEEMIAAERFKGGLLAIIDIDNFKQVNDRLGHQKGDETLILFANNLAQGWGDEAVVFRLGGDEFGVFAENDDFTAALEQLKEVKATLSMNITEGRRSVHITGSAGVVQVCGHQEKFHRLYALADHALYKSKEEGKNRITVYDPTMWIQEDENRLMRELKDAFVNGEIQVYYQPIIRSINQKVCGYEALARWIHPQRGIIAPKDFIPGLEVRKQVHKLDLYVLEKVCQSLQKARDQKIQTVPVSVNLSKFDFYACDIYGEVEKIVTRYQIPRNLINIEITESFTMENPSIVREEMSRFQKAGYQIWLDDFGFGYSSLNLLKIYRFDLLKLDRVFMVDMDEVTRNIIIAVTTMTKKLGIHTLAEGVETREQYEFLRDIGCEKIQGFYFGKAMPEACTIQLHTSSDRELERMEWQGYYDALGRVDFLTDRPLAIIDYDGAELKYLYVNPSYQKEWKSTGIHDPAAGSCQAQSSDMEFQGQFRKFLEELEPDGSEKEMNYACGGSYVRLIGRSLYEQDGHRLARIEINHLTQ